MSVSICVVEKKKKKKRGWNKIGEEGVIKLRTSEKSLFLSTSFNFIYFIYRESDNVNNVVFSEIHSFILI